MVRYICLFIACCLPCFGQVTFISTNNGTNIVINGQVTVTNTAPSCNDYLANLFVRLRFDDGTGSAAADVEGNAPGTLSGTSAPTWLSTANAKVGTSAILTAASQSYVALSLPNATFPGGGTGTAFSVSVWAYKVGAGDEDPRAELIAGLAGNHNTFFDIGNGSGGIPFVQLETSTGDYTMQGGSAVGAGVWHLWTITYDGANAILYEDASSIAATAATGTLANNGDSPATIACAANFLGSFTFNGRVDDFRIYSTALTSGQVTTIYGATGNTCRVLFPDLEWLWRYEV